MHALGYFVLGVLVGGFFGLLTAGLAQAAAIGDRQMDNVIQFRNAQ